MQCERLVPSRPWIPPPGWKCPNRFKLGIGEGDGDSDENDKEVEMDVLLLMASQQYEEQVRITWSNKSAVTLWFV